MTENQFAQLVEKLEKYATKKPSKYKWKVGLFAGIGYLYILFWLLFSVAVTVGLILMVVFGDSSSGVIKGILIFGILSFYVLKALWVKHSPPEGLNLTKEDAPELINMVNEIKNQLKTPKIHTILLTSEFNAAISQVPRLGVFGLHKNYLILGLPLMQGTSPDEFKAIVAHELAHLSKAHGRFSGWIYRIRASWFRLMQTLEEKDTWAGFLFKGFFKWFVPRFDAYSFVLAREDEYVADNGAAIIAGADTAASALTRISTIGNMNYQEFWKSFYLQSYHQKECLGPYSKLSEELKKNLPESQISLLMKKELLVQTGYTDTHPSLKDRINALGSKVLPPENLVETASTFYLQNFEDNVIKTFNEDWMARNQEFWGERYIEGQVLIKELEKLEQPTTYEEAKKKLEIVEEIYGPEVMIKTYDEVSKHVPAINENFELKYQVASLLIGSGNKMAIPILEEIMKQNWEVKLRSLLALQYYYTIFEGENEQLKEIEERLEQWYSILNKAKEEMGTINLEWDYQISQDDELINYYTKVIAQHSDITNAYLVKRTLDSMTTREVYYLIIDTKLSVGKSDSEKIRAELLNELIFPHDTYILMSRLESIAKNLADHVTGCQIYKKERINKKKAAS